MRSPFSLKSFTGFSFAIKGYNVDKNAKLVKDGQESVASDAASIVSSSSNSAPTPTPMEDVQIEPKPADINGIGVAHNPQNETAGTFSASTPSTAMTSVASSETKNDSEIKTNGLHVTTSESMLVEATG